MVKVKAVHTDAVVSHHVCPTCSNLFEGKVCNQCGEKVFHPAQLSTKSFLHQTVDIFTHFENKVLKSIWLTIRRPGLLTKENLTGVRVHYAKPVQLFIVVNLLFYMVVNFFGRTDYIPSIGDNYSSFISERPLLGWTAPLDHAIAVGLENLASERLPAYQEKLKTTPNPKFIPYQGDISKEFNSDQLQLLAYYAYNQKVTFLSKTLIFTLIPVIGLLFFVFFRKRLKYYGAALILATHFLAFNLLLYMAFLVLNFLPQKLFDSQDFSRIPIKVMEAVFYNDWLAPISRPLLGLYAGFEATHLICWSVWLFVAFRRLLGLHWLQNLVVSYLLSRILFLLVFSLYKKFLIACTLWSL